MPQTIFSDGVAEVVVMGGVVRIDFFTLAVDRNAVAEEGKPPPMQRVREVTVAMPVPAFAGTMNALDNARQRLIADGVIPAAPAAAAAAAPDRSPPAPSAPPRKSP